MRIGIYLALVGLLCGIGVQAQTPAAPQNGKLDPKDMLSAKQIADGWIQLFDGATDYGWKPRGDAKWTIKDGGIESEAEKAGSLCTTTEFGEGTLHFECLHRSPGKAGIAMAIHTENGVDATNASVFYFSKESEHPRPVDRPPRSPINTSWTTYDFVARGDEIRLFINEEAAASFKVSSPRGYIGLLTDSKEAVQFRNIRFKPEGLKSVFNGKDLTGWIAPEGNKSVFRVTKEGWLNLKSGKGDLQTIDQWGDFVLQIDVYSNGDHLNSGVFFRAEPGKFEQGYDRTNPVDYGTGAVYNRLPVRKVVSSDREWFTMTLIAHGNHIGSWVNGVLVCDFTDARPPDQTNARKGARTKAGVISLQGHEPDTDLNFRNIRIVELPPADK
jgi:hypothetical protein